MLLWLELEDGVHHSIDAKVFSLGYVTRWRGASLHRVEFIVVALVPGDIVIVAVIIIFAKLGLVQGRLISDRVHVDVAIGENVVGENVGENSVVILVVARCCLLDSIVVIGILDNSVVTQAKIVVIGIILLLLKTTAGDTRGHEEDEQGDGGLLQSGRLSSEATKGDIQRSEGDGLHLGETP